MDVQPNHQPNLNLPPLGGEELPDPSNHENLPSVNPENLPNPESSPAQAYQPTTPLVPAVPGLPIQDDNLVIDVPQDDQASQLSAPISDDSRDLIAKEWVIRAKQIVAMNRNDPHKQSQEFNKLKAEYIKQRYNMTLKSP